MSKGGSQIHFHYYKYCSESSANRKFPQIKALQFFLSSKVFTSDHDEQFNHTHNKIHESDPLSARPIYNANSIEWNPTRSVIIRVIDVIVRTRLVYGGSKRFPAPRF